MPPPLGALVEIVVSDGSALEGGDGRVTPADRSCAAYEACSDLVGNCCPNTRGTFLNCCSAGTLPADGMSAGLLEAIISLLQLSDEEAARLRLVIQAADEQDGLPTFILQISDGPGRPSDELTALLLANLDELRARLMSQELELISVQQKGLPSPPPNAPPSPPSPPPKLPPSPPCLASGEAMALREGVAAGSTTLQVVSMLCGLAVGESLLVNRGAATEEVVTIAGFGSILLEGGLLHDHSAGEEVTRVEAPSGPPIVDTTENVGTGDGDDTTALVVPLVLCLVFLCILLCLCMCCFARREQRRRLIEQELAAYKAEKEAKEAKARETPRTPGSVRIGRRSVNLGYGERRWTQVPLDALAGFSRTLPSPGRSMRHGSSTPRRPPAPGAPPAPGPESWQSLDILAEHARGGSV